MVNKGVGQQEFGSEIDMGAFFGYHFASSIQPLGKREQVGWRGGELLNKSDGDAGSTIYGLN